VLEVRTTRRFSNRSGEWMEIEGVEIGKRGAPLRDWMGCNKERAAYVNAASIGAVRRAPIVGDTVREPDGWYGRVARVYSDRETGQRMCRLYARPGETDGRRVRSWDLERIETTPPAGAEADEQHQDPAERPALPRRRERTPSPRQAAYLADIAAHDGAPAYELPGYGTYGINTEVAVVSAGWVEVDRGTPDNRGGDRREYRHTLTEAGLAALARAGVNVPRPDATTERDQEPADPQSIECDRHSGQPVDGAED
jgi:hypothetical protein